VFASPAEVDDRSALAALVAHVQYRDSYAPSTFADANTIHGPYWLHAISPQTFTVADPAEVEALTRTGGCAHTQAPL
jgi:hypothetical protein